MLIIQISISKSGTLTRSKKKLFHILFSTIAIAAFCEWMGSCLQGTGGGTRVLHIMVKTVEFSISPMIAVVIAWIIDARKSKVILVILAAHALLEFMSGIFGFIYYVDGNGIYTHENFYWIYMVAYFCAITYMVYTIVKNVRKYQYNGIAFFISIVVFMLSGIVIQSIYSDLKVDYVIMSVNAIMLYVFTLEMIQQTDQLTELINRRGYENYITHLDDECIVVFFDIDKFKEANDVNGHAYGDVCISRVGRTIKKIYSRYGKCFRFGGDEFCVILTRKLEDTDRLNTEFMHAIDAFRATDSKMPTVSIGYASYDPDTGNIRDTIEAADRMMYQYKEAHR